MYFMGLKKWIENKIVKFCYDFIMKNMAVSPGGVEYNPLYFNDSLVLMEKLRQKIEELEEQSEQFRHLNQLKKQINMLSLDTNQSIAQISTILTQIIVALNRHVSEARYQYVSDENMLESSNTTREILKKRLVEINQYKRQLQDYQTLLLSKHSSLNEKIDNLREKPLLGTQSLLFG